MAEIFKKVHLSEKKKFFKELVNEKATLLVKGEREDVKQIVVRSLFEERTLICDFVKGQEFNVRSAEIYTVNANTEQDRFFFSGIVLINDGKVYLEVQGDLYFLQRRKTARMDIPESYPSQVKILDLNGDPLPYQGKILDISSGGCRLSFSSIEPKVNVGYTLRVRLVLGARATIDAKVMVRHIKPIKTFEDLPQVFGVEFSSKDMTSETKMMNLYMDIQREIFLKYAKRN